MCVFRFLSGPHLFNLELDNEIVISTEKIYKTKNRNVKEKWAPFCPDRKGEAEREKPFRGANCPKRKKKTTHYSFGANAG